MTKRPAVLLMHDYLSSSEDFINNGNNSLGFLLALDGYDVWMGNNRGNIYSQGNLNLNISNLNYFNFSFVEMGNRDIPAMIKYILSVSGQSQITYIGHS